MKSGEITIKDIAQQLNVSVSTVSRALRGAPEINKETKQAVLELAQRLDYQPNPIALGLVKNQTRIIGVIIPSFTIPFYASAISGIQEAATKAGYNIIICQSNESLATEIAVTRTLLASRIDGLIVSLSRETTTFDHFHRLVARELPMVFFNRVCESLPTSRVIVDDYAGAYQATKHLLDVGCRRIAHIAGPQNLLLSQQRLQGYLDALEHAGCPVLPELIRHGDLTIDNGAAIANYLLGLPGLPDGLFAVCDSAAFGAMQVIKSRGLSIPGDVALVGFTNEPVAAIVEPPLTTVAQPVFEIGQTAAELLLQEINAGKAAKLTTKVLQTELIVRKSSMKQVLVP